MNPFVNPEHRGIDLPGGCKDLIDVLQMKPDGLFWPVAIQRYLSLLLDPKPKLRGLTISCSPGRATIRLGLSPFCAGYSPWLVSVSVFVEPTDPREELAVRGVFQKAGISPLLKSVAAGSGPIKTLHYPLPPTVCDAACLIAEVLQQAFGATESTPLWFDCFGRLG